tara:strand:+ start:279 stop:509 length:231 start_codon:yes stop_codon:yes gene_type:complete
MKFAKKNSGMSVMQIHAANELVCRWVDMLGLGRPAKRAGKAAEPVTAIHRNTVECITAVEIECILETLHLCDAASL